MVADSSGAKAKEGKAGGAAKELPLNFLKKITNDFSDERIVGHGKFGTHYKV
jgi:hypothetical protein